MERALLGLSGLTRLLDVLYPRDNLMVNEPYRKYIYAKPAPRFPDCPYQVVMPRKRLRHAAVDRAKLGLSSAVRRAQHLGRLLDTARGRRHDEAERRGALVYFF